MKIIHSIIELRSEIKKFKLLEKKIGFVPTMGALHEGHLSLARTAAKNQDVCVVSIFVNPTQFGKGEDYEKYPRTLELDAELLATIETETQKPLLVFAPTVSEMYPNDRYSLTISMPDLTNRFCGISRPGHFEGVALVVSKLFHIVEPDVAYFGQKDYQQTLVIKRLVSVLNFPIEIQVLPTLREPDGLAMSSRNAYLTAEERKIATVLFQVLSNIQANIQKGERSVSQLIQTAKQTITQFPQIQLDYLDVVNGDTLEPL
ncbi:MAG: pantoate--beta-alanine ligase, partial [Bacteroidia bacterium]|nr:pantoate--beta-alanine ligase [Bacteroidia bacterium]